MNFESVLITGGTGSFGKQHASQAGRGERGLARVIVFSRDELKQFELANEAWLQPHLDRVRFFLGDVRDVDRLKRGVRGHRRRRARRGTEAGAGGGI